MRLGEAEPDPGGGRARAGARGESAAMKVGRNEPCPCGSGKKYKACCLKADQDAAAPAEASVAPTPARTDAVDPWAAAAEAGWEASERGDDEGCLGLFVAPWEEPGGMGRKLAFGMLPQPHTETARGGGRDRYDHLVETFRARRPDLYAA